MDLLEGIIGDSLYAVILFGSLAKGMATEHSDIDVLIVVSSLTDEAYRGICNAALEVYERYGEDIEFMVYNIEEFMAKYYDESNPFMYEVRNYGKVLYLSEEVLKKRVTKLLSLAEEYFNYALKAHDMGAYRLCIDACQNAVELILKAMIMYAGKPLPSTHGGYIHVFVTTYVKERGELSDDVVSLLYKMLEVRNKARYDPDAVITSEDCRWALDLYRRISGWARSKIGSS